ncbi:MAG: purine-nucleoside phosphorylase [Anaerolineae bacterium]|nr:purine-nucleoside phosphorylase [Anaerolineae bacterium]
MSIHIGAKPGEIANTILLPGDPLRARFIAETFLEDAFCFNNVRGMLGFTGRYGSKIVSVMGSGMGIPTLSIYVNELISEYNVKNLIRVGTCGALQSHLHIGDIVLAISSSTNSAINKLRFNGMDYAPTVSFSLLMQAYELTQKRGIHVDVGSIFSSDTFYEDNPDWWQKWADFGVLVCEMETAGLYTLAAKLGAHALSILTVSDSLVTGEEATSEQRERHFPLMAEIALEIAS